MLRPVRRLLVAGILVAAGCGGGPSDTEQVRSTVESFGQATVAQDYQRMCDRLLTPKLVAKIESVGLPCEVALRKGFEDVKAPKLTIGAIKVDGDRASAEINTSAQGQPPSKDTMQLERVRGTWRIASLADER